MRRLLREDKKQFAKIANALERLRTDHVPFWEYDVKKIAGEEGLFRIRIGEFIKVKRRGEMTYDLWF